MWQLTYNYLRPWEDTQRKKAEDRILGNIHVYRDVSEREVSTNMTKKEQLERWEDNGADFQREGKNSEVSYTIGTMLVTGE